MARRRAPPRPEQLRARGARKAAKRGARKRPAPREEPKVRRPSVALSHGELELLLAACGDHDAGVRDRALFSLMACTGVRLSEALAVRLEDIVWDTRRITIIQGKNGKSRTVGIWPKGFGRKGPHCQAAIDAWIEISPGPERGPIVCNLKGKPLSTPYVRAALREYAAEAGIKRRAHSHGFRHYVAVAMLEGGANLAAIAHQLGHSNTTVTHRYLSTIGADRLLEQFDALG